MLRSDQKRRTQIAQVGMMYKTSLLDAVTIIQMFQTGIYLELRGGLAGLQSLWNGPAQFCWCGSGDSR
jgi:hypothetical protein